MDWNDNPRIDIEKRIRQLEKRWRLIYDLRRKLSKGSWGLSDRGKQATNDTIKELRLKRAQLKGFDKTPNFKLIWDYLNETRGLD